MFTRSFGPLLVCMAAMSGCGLFGPTTDRAPPPPAVAQIAYIGPDDQLYLAEADGSGARQLTQSVAGLSSLDGWTFKWPTYSPDGRRVAFAGYRTQAGELLSGAVLSADVGRGAAAVLLESEELAPIYLYWAPDNRHLTALLQQGDTLELHLLDAVGSEQPRRLLAGQPLYWSWAPDGSNLAVHVGGDARSNDAAWVGLLHVRGDGTQEERFADAPGNFRAPAWSPDGRKLAYVGLGGGTSILTIRDASGQLARIASSTTELAFSWSPKSDWLAFASASPEAPGTYQGVEIVRADGTQRLRLSQDGVVAFYWSPDGHRLALVSVETDANALALSVLGEDGRGRRKLGTFVPSDDFAYQLPFFDQFAQSTRLWSPDGRKLVYAAEANGERRNGSTPGERIMLVDVEGQAQSVSIARGGAAVWSP